MKNEARNIVSCARGFSLFEVIVAMTILSIVIVLVMQLFSAGLKMSRVSCDYTRAVIYAKGIMEQISDPPADDSGEFEDGYTWETEIAPYEDSEEMAANLMQIKVKVSWSDGLRSDKVIEIVSLRALIEEEAL